MLSFHSKHAIRTALALLLLVGPGPAGGDQTPSVTPSAAEPLHQVQHIDGDTWLTTNASYERGRWTANDPARASFALWMNEDGTMPYEGKTSAAGLWVRRAGCPRTFESFASSCGWNAGLTLTQWKTVIVGGNTIEVDGNGVAPYGRFTNATDGRRRYIGVASNVFGDFSGVDVTARSSWLFAINLTDDAYQVKRQDPSSKDGRRAAFRTLLDLDRGGHLAVAGGTSTARAEQSARNQWSTRERLRHGRLRFVYPRSYRATPVCVATSEGGEGYVLHVAPGMRACEVFSANSRDTSTIDVVVIGNPD